MILDYTGQPIESLNGHARERAWNSGATDAFLRTGFANVAQMAGVYEANAWVFAGIGAKARALKSSPLVVNTGSIKKPSPVPDDHPLQKFFDRPSKTMPRSQVWLATVIGIDCFEGAYWLLTGKTGWRQPNEPPIEAFPVLGTYPAMLDESGAIITDRATRVAAYQFSGSETPGKSSVIVPAHAVLRFTNLNPRDFLKGMPTVTAANLSVNGSYNAGAWNSAFFGNSADPGGWLTNPGRLPNDAYEQLKARWNEQHQGPWKRGRTAILESGVTYTPNPRTQKDMEFLGYLTWARDEILAVLGVPKTILSITDDLNYATHEGQQRIFYENTMLSLMADIEDVLWTQFFATYESGRYFARFDTTTINALNADFGNRVNTGTALKSLGFSTKAINARLNLGMKDEDIVEDTTDVVDEIVSPTTDGAAPTGDVPAGAESVQDTALNGAQIAALKTIVSDVAAGLLPAESAIAMIPLAFPTIDEAKAKEIVLPAAKQQAQGATTTGPTPEPTADQPVVAEEKAQIPAMRFCRTDEEVASGLLLWKRAAINTLQKRLARRIASYFKDLRKDQAERLAKWIEDKGLADDFVVEKLTKEDLQRILFARDQWDKFLREAGEQPIADIVKASGKAIKKELGFYAPPDPLLLEIQGQVLSSLVVVNKDTRKKIRSSLIQSVAEGETIHEMQSRIVDHVETIGGPSRALRIAVTETGFAQSTTRFESFKDAGIERTKWLTTGRNTRSSHQRCHNQVREIGKTFPNGLKHPHELGAPADEVVNCHCESVAVL